MQATCSGIFGMQVSNAWQEGELAGARVDVGAVRRCQG